jgi:hypothetical protein
MPAPYSYDLRSKAIEAVKRGEFIRKLDLIEKRRRVYVDEAGFDNRDDYPYGYSPRGERCHALRSGKRTERVSWLSALKQGITFVLAPG